MGEDLRRLFDLLDAQSLTDAPPGECHTPADVIESSQQVEVIVDLPGVPPDQVQVVFAGGTVLVAGVKRASNILTIEEKKDKTSYTSDYDFKRLEAKAEIALAAAIESVKQDTIAAINVENFTGAMNALADLRKPVDDFFDQVTVNADNPELRKNRLHLLSQIRAATLGVADFSKIAG